MQNGSFIIDSVIHAMNLHPSNNANRDGQMISDLVYGVNQHVPDGYRLPKETVQQDWTVDDTAKMCFGESDTDVAVFHPTPIMAYKDGQTSVEKAIDATNRWPNRFIGGYATLDPLTGSQAQTFEELARQVEAIHNPIGLKLYPTSWRGDVIDNWRMDDPERLYPLYEAAASHGINTIAVHKAIPLGSVPTNGAFNPADVEGAAAAFPHLNFEIVHGGVAFCEETAWLLARFENIWVNLETLTIILVSRPRIFAQLVLGLVDIGGEAMLDRLLWSTGAMQIHPRLCLEAFERFTFPEDLLGSKGMFAAVPQITDDHKRKILGENYARMHGLDIEALKAGIADDEFSREPNESLPKPYSTTTLADKVLAPA